ncbi:MAG: aminoglycoside phosphotransferase family protein [Clostridia bacterium]|nr:aminoglycoside phosphotransferase family protein [Clostridia bacterium]
MIMHMDQGAAQRCIEAALRRKPERLVRLEGVTNNGVYAFSVGGEGYIFKAYRSPDWPEDGKLPFVNRVLRERRIPCAELIAFRRYDDALGCGWLIERQVPGLAADRAAMDERETVQFYGELGRLVSRVHQIELQRYGYIGSGVPSHARQVDFYADEWEDRFGVLVREGVFTQASLACLRDRFMTMLTDFADLPPVLCHGDLSLKNVIIQPNGDLALIDWDDATAFCWMADIARMTAWMRMQHDEADMQAYRRAFLAEYQTGYRREDFDRFEAAYHIYTALDNLVYFRAVGDGEGAARMKAWAAQKMV